MSFEYENVKEYINLFHPRFIRGNLIFWIVLTLLSGISTAFIGSPSLSLKAVTIVITVIIMTLYLWIIINPVKRMKEYIMVFGVGCLLLPLLLILAGHRFYSYDQTTHPYSFLIVGLSVHIFEAILIFSTFIHRAKTGRLIKKNKHKKSKYKKQQKKYWLKIVVLIGIIGIYYLISCLIKNILAQYSISTERLGIIAFATILLAFGCILEYGVHFIFKYYLIKKFENYEYNAANKRKVIHKANN